MQLNFLSTLRFSMGVSCYQKPSEPVLAWGHFSYFWHTPSHLSSQGFLYRSQLAMPAYKFSGCRSRNCRFVPLNMLPTFLVEVELLLSTCSRDLLASGPTY